MARPKIDNPKLGMNARHRESTLARATRIGAVTGRSVRAVITDALEDYVKREERKLVKEGKLRSPAA